MSCDSLSIHVTPPLARDYQKSSDELDVPCAVYCTGSAELWFHVTFAIT